MYRFCGTEEENQKKTVHSDGNFFRVTFKSNDVYDATGFEAFYQFMKQEEGEGDLGTLCGIGLYIGCLINVFVCLFVCVRVCVCACMPACSVMNSLTKT